uniref:Uncharacterized protein n=1 Tax=Avena sativa TaxID=4498 RepID=A0ACD5UPH5_AVESA
MASTEERLWHKSGETVGLLASSHGAYYPSSCTERTDLGCPEDLGELHDPLEEEDVVNSHYQPASMWTDSDACAIAFRALDLMFPREDSPDDSSDWSDWSAREEECDIDDGQVIDGNNEKDGPGSKIVDECSTQNGCDEDDDYNGYSKEKDKETDCPGSEVVDDCSTQEGSDKDDDCNGQVKEKDKETNCPAESALGYRTPEQMLQFFSMCLSSFDPPYPVSVYGIFAVRDELDQRRNYIFNRSRDDAVFIEKQDSFVLPLCSPCRGMYVLNRALLEVDLWVKRKGMYYQLTSSYFLHMLRLIYVESLIPCIMHGLLVMFATWT